MSTPIHVEVAQAIRDAFGVSSVAPAFLEAIAMQLGLSSHSQFSVPHAIAEAGEAQANAGYAIAESIDRLAAAIEKLGVAK